MDITLYTASWCRDCRAAKRFLEKHNLPYNEIDIDLWQDLPTLPLYEAPITTVSRNALQGVAPAETWPSFLFDAETWSWELNAPPTVTTTTTTVG